MAADLSDEGSINEAVLSLARILFVGQSVDETLEAIARAACDTIGDCDTVSVTVLSEGRLHTSTATSEVAAALDSLQYETEAGPCLDAMRTGEPVRVDDLDRDPRWPKLARAAGEHGVRSALGLPLAAGEGPVGSLNLYSFTLASFQGAEPVARAFAAQATVTLANATAFHQATDLAYNLAIALERRDTIGQAKGILMARQGVGPDEAFDLLRRASQRSNRKLHDIAVEIVERRASGLPEE